MRSPLALGDPRPPIADSQEHAGLVPGHGCADLRAGAVPAGVLEEVAQEMPEQPVISLDADRVSGRISDRISDRRPDDCGIDPRAFLGGEGQEIHRRRRLQVLHRLQPAREQQLVDEGVQFGDVPLDALAKLRARRVGEELDRHANPGEGAAQLV